MNKTYFIISLFVLCAFSLSANEKAISKTQEEGKYTITLKVLPPESFTGPNAEMVWDGGAKPVELSSKPSPNHHLVTFIIKGAEPVEKADVAIQYRKKEGHWISLPVARMHVSGKGLETTHFGNNVYLAPGDYEVQVSVDKSRPALFHIKL